MRRTTISLSAISLALFISALAAGPVPDIALLNGGPLHHSHGKPGSFVAADLEFKKDGTYTLTYEDPRGVSYDTGSFSIEGRQVRLTPVKCHAKKNDRAINCKDSAGEFTCAVTESAESLYYSQFLSCKQKKAGGAEPIDFPIPASKVKSGEKRTIQGIRVITMGAREGVTTTNVKIRKSPSTDAEAVMFLDFDVQAELPSVPANRRVTILARTERKEKVGQWNNYWYYIVVGDDQSAWMYGEFVSMKGN